MEGAPEPEDTEPAPLGALRSLTQLRFLIPCVTLAFIAGGVVLERATRAPWKPIEIVPPPEATLPPLEREPLDTRLAGRVVGPERTPVEDALVFVRVGGRPSWSYTAADGSFDVDGLASGTRHVSVVARGLEPLALDIEGESAGEVELAARPPTASLPDVERATLVGRVVPAGSLPLGAYELQLVPTAPPEVFGGAFPRTVEIAEDGAFVVEDLAGGAYQVRVVPTWARGGSWPDLTSTLGETKLVPYEHLAGGHGPVDGAEPELSLPLLVGAARGRLVDERGEPLEGALVLVHPAGSPRRVWPPVATGEDGAFELTDLPAGEYLLTIRAGAGAAEVPLTIRAGESATVDVGRFTTRAPR